MLAEMKISGFRIRTLTAAAATLTLQACGLGTPISSSSTQTTCPANTTIFQIGDNSLTVLCGCTGSGQLAVYDIRATNLVCTVPLHNQVQFQFIGTAVQHTVTAFGQTFQQTQTPNQTLTYDANAVTTTAFYEAITHISGAIGVN